MSYQGSGGRKKNLTAGFERFYGFRAKRSSLPPFTGLVNGGSRRGAAGIDPPKKAKKGAVFGNSEA
jgi:hypothetical protein